MSHEMGSSFSRLALIRALAEIIPVEKVGVSNMIRTDEIKAALEALGLHVGGEYLVETLLYLERNKQVRRHLGNHWQQPRRVEE